jgi:Mn-dependent DtxR family transcriptional regulator
LSNIENIPKEEENRLKELGLIKVISGKAILTHSGREILKIIKENI